MDRERREMIKLSGVAALMLIAGAGCDPEEILDTGKDDDSSSSAQSSASGTGLAVSLAKRIDPDSDRIVLAFSQPVDPTTVNGREIRLEEKSGRPPRYRVEPDAGDPSGQTVGIVLEAGEAFRESWKYTVRVSTGVRSVTGESLPAETVLGVMTLSRSPFDGNGNGRTKIVVISDIHMGEQRGADDRYSLFTENAAALTEFLERVRVSPQIKELVILGDMMDIWVVPMAYETLRGSIADAEAFYRAVAAAPVNKSVVDKLNRIADEGNVELVYVPGNHDMSMTKEIFEAIFPNGVWKGGAPGTGVYYPEAPSEEIVFEHGHNYDLFNAPDPLTTYGSLLPPGYFISRIYASRNMSVNARGLPAAGSGRNILEEFAYTTGWDLAVSSITFPGFDPDKREIVTGYGGYTQTLSPNEARDLYTSTIDDNWEQRQKLNGVYEPEPFLVSELNGSGSATFFGSLEVSAGTQYFSPNRSRIVVFGHTHMAMLSAEEWDRDCIYANTGTWVDEQYLEEGTETGTFVVVDSANASGSDLHNVTVFRYEGGGAVRKLDEGLIDVTA